MSLSSVLYQIQVPWGLMTALWLCWVVTGLVHTWRIRLYKVCGRGLEVWLKQQSTCVASSKPWVQILVLSNQKQHQKLKWVSEKRIQTGLEMPWAVMDPRLTVAIACVFTSLSMVEGVRVLAHLCPGSHITDMEVTSQGWRYLAVIFSPHCHFPMFTLRSQGDLCRVSW
jgi:hypothetical protein